VTFQLPKPPSEGSLIEGEIHLKWTSPILRPSAARFLAAPLKKPKAKKKEAGEDILARILAGMSPAQKADYQNKLTALSHQVTTLQNVVEVQRKRSQALCEVFGNKIPGYPNLCSVARNNAMLRTDCSKICAWLISTRFLPGGFNPRTLFGSPPGRPPTAANR
jgi:hypothetical protein